MKSSTLSRRTRREHTEQSKVEQKAPNQNVSHALEVPTPLKLAKIEAAPNSELRISNTPNSESPAPTAAQKTMTETPSPVAAPQVIEPVPVQENSGQKLSQEPSHEKKKRGRPLQIKPTEGDPDEVIRQNVTLIIRRGDLNEISGYSQAHALHIGRVMADAVVAYLPELRGKN